MQLLTPTKIGVNILGLLLHSILCSHAKLSISRVVTNMMTEQLLAYNDI